MLTKQSKYRGVINIQEINEWKIQGQGSKGKLVIRWTRLRAVEKGRDMQVRLMQKKRLETGICRTY